MLDPLKFYIEAAGWEKVVTEIAIIFLFLLLTFRLVHGTRGAGVLRGLVFLLVIALVGILFVVKHFQLYAIEWLMTSFLPIFIVPFVVILQPELRRALVRLGQNPLLRFFLRGESTVADELVRSVTVLSRKRIGALIAIEREILLGGFIEGGVPLDAQLTAELMCTIFFPNTMLHDGAVVIRNQRIAAAGCLFPLSESPGVSADLGTRHRAALGLTEETDAVAIIVSEETGTISMAVRGQMTRNLDAESVRRLLDEFALDDVAKHNRRRR